MQTIRLVIIGAGPGGYPAAIEAAQRGAQVTLIDKEQPGGTCLFRGCIPSKIMRRTADIINDLSNASIFGIDLQSTPLINMESLRKRQEGIIKTQSDGLAKQLKAAGAVFLQGEALVDKAAGLMVKNGETSTPVEYDHLLIATGSTPMELPGMTGEAFMSSDEALWTKDIPKRLLVLGGGVIGCELAQIYKSLGSEVTLVEALPRLLPIASLDEEISKNYARSLKKIKLPFYVGHSMSEVKAIDGGYKALLKAVGGNGESKEIVIDKILIAIGRRPSHKNMGLEKLGVTFDSQAWIEAGEDFRTKGKNVWAIGDALGPSRIMLAHVATFEALAVVENIFGGKKTVEYKHVPSAVFTAPEIGSVGLSLAQAQESKPGSKAHDFLFRQLGKAQAMGETDGLIRLIAGPDGKVLGGHLIGACSTSLIAEIGLAVTCGLRLNDLARTIHAHPTLAEGIWEAAMKP